VEPRRPHAVRGWSGAPWLVVATVCIGAFMGQLDASIVTLAVPSIRGDLHVSLSSVEWVALSYLLVLVATVSAVGRMSDMFGRKLFYFYGFVVFTVASLGCGLAPSLGWLLGCRVVQAVGAAMLQANSVALIRTNISADKLGRAIGIQGAAQAIGLALGPAVGGLLIGLAGWRWVFFVNVPAGLFGLVLGWLLLPRTRSHAPRARLDWPGLLLLFPAVAALLWGLSRAADGRVLSVAVLAPVALGVVLLALFVRAERRSAAPLIEPALFAQRSFTTGVTSGLLAYLVLFGALFVTPLYLEAGAGISPAHAGLVLCVLPLMLGMVAPLAGHAADRIGSRLPTVAGLSIAATGAVLLLLGPATVTGISVALGVLGLGLGLFIPANNATVAGSGTAQQAGMVSGVLNMTRGVGTSLGVAVIGTAYALGLGVPAHPGAAPAERGLHAAALVLIVVALSGSAVAAATGTTSPRRAILAAGA
jgi:EmrB/QacA subfamily drug resistance transporter